eukprot:TRINITY_DN20843_c0_g1_i3.p1 TRINITY_DN20843_c0_g1~~TRINITY_DN20843_c0_g1_i3.p1  ORF type:complete len:1929 (+),score=337.56 TRINITY_DN20843_c0_g1_i3:45-5831(+)
MASAQSELQEASADGASSPVAEESSQLLPTDLAELEAELQALQASLDKQRTVAHGGSRNVDDDDDAEEPVTSSPEEPDRLGLRCESDPSVPETSSASCVEVPSEEVPACAADSSAEPGISEVPERAEVVESEFSTKSSVHASVLDHSSRDAAPAASTSELEPAPSDEVVQSSADADVGALDGAMEAMKALEALRAMNLWQPPGSSSFKFEVSKPTKDDSSPDLVSSQAESADPTVAPGETEFSFLSLTKHGSSLGQASNSNEKAPMSFDLKVMSMAPSTSSEPSHSSSVQHNSLLHPSLGTKLEGSGLQEDRGESCDDDERPRSCDAKIHAHPRFSVGRLGESVENGAPRASPVFTVLASPEEAAKTASLHADTLARVPQLFDISSPKSRTVEPMLPASNAMLDEVQTAEQQVDVDSKEQSSIEIVAANVSSIAIETASSSHVHDEMLNPRELVETPQVDDVSCVVERPLDDADEERHAPGELCSSTDVSSLHFASNAKKREPIAIEEEPPAQLRAVVTAISPDEVTTSDDIGAQAAQREVANLASVPSTTDEVKSLHHGHEQSAEMTLPLVDVNSPSCDVKPPSSASEATTSVVPGIQNPLELHNDVTPGDSDVATSSPTATGSRSDRSHIASCVQDESSARTPCNRGPLESHLDHSSESPCDTAEPEVQHVSPPLHLAPSSAVFACLQTAERSGFTDNLNLSDADPLPTLADDLVESARFDTVDAADDVPAVAMPTMDRAALENGANLRPLSPHMSGVDSDIPSHDMQESNIVHNAELDVGRDDSTSEALKALQALEALNMLPACTVNGPSSGTNSASQLLSSDDVASGILSPHRPDSTCKSCELEAEPKLENVTSLPLVEAPQHSAMELHHDSCHVSQGIATSDEFTMNSLHAEGASAEVKGGSSDDLLGRTTESLKDGMNALQALEPFESSPIRTIAGELVTPDAELKDNQFKLVESSVPEDKTFIESGSQSNEQSRLSDDSETMAYGPDACPIVNLVESSMVMAAASIETESNSLTHEQGRLSDDSQTMDNGPDACCIANDIDASIALAPASVQAVSDSLSNEQCGLPNDSHTMDHGPDARPDVSSGGPHMVVASGSSEAESNFLPNEQSRLSNDSHSVDRGPDVSPIADPQENIIVSVSTAESTDVHNTDESHRKCTETDCPQDSCVSPDIGTSTFVDAVQSFDRVHRTVDLTNLSLSSEVRVASPLQTCSAERPSTLPDVPLQSSDDHISASANSPSPDRESMAPSPSKELQLDTCASDGGSTDVRNLKVDASTSESEVRSVVLDAQVNDAEVHAEQPLSASSLEHGMADVATEQPMLAASVSSSPVNLAVAESIDVQGNGEKSCAEQSSPVGLPSQVEAGMPSMLDCVAGQPSTGDVSASESAIALQTCSAERPSTLPDVPLQSSNDHIPASVNSPSPDRESMVLSPSAEQQLDTCTSSVGSTDDRNVEVDASTSTSEVRSVVLGAQVNDAEVHAEQPLSAALPEHGTADVAVEQPMPAASVRSSPVNSAVAESIDVERDGEKSCAEQGSPVGLPSQVEAAMPSMSDCVASQPSTGDVSASENASALPHSSAEELRLSRCNIGDEAFDSQESGALGHGSAITSQTASRSQEMADCLDSVSAAPGLVAGAPLAPDPTATTEKVRKAGGVTFAEQPEVISKTSMESLQAKLACFEARTGRGMRGPKRKVPLGSAALPQRGGPRLPPIPEESPVRARPSSLAQATVPAANPRSKRLPAIPGVPAPAAVGAAALLAAAAPAAPVPNTAGLRPQAGEMRASAEGPSEDEAAMSRSFQGVKLPPVEPAELAAVAARARASAEAPFTATPAPPRARSAVGTIEEQRQRVASKLEVLQELTALQNAVGKLSAVQMASLRHKMGSNFGTSDVRTAAPSVLSNLSVGGSRKASMPPAYRALPVLPLAPRR